LGEKEISEFSKLSKLSELSNLEGLFFYKLTTVFKVAKVQLIRNTSAKRKEGKMDQNIPRKNRSGDPFAMRGEPGHQTGWPQSSQPATNCSVTDQRGGTWPPDNPPPPFGSAFGEKYN
jgi:hypothetical protein